VNFLSCNLFAGSLSCYSIARAALKSSLFSLKGKAIMFFAPQEKGQGLIEYAIILSLVAMIVIAVMWLLGPQVGDSYSSINSSIP
jgi:pilus assembly protein Flp/PilA